MARYFPADDAEAVDGEEATRQRRAVGTIRPLIGIIGLLMLGYEWIQARGDSQLATNSEASAIQYIQLYVPHIFDAILVIGIMIALYIVTRGMES